MSGDTHDPCRRVGRQACGQRGDEPILQLESVCVVDIDAGHAHKHAVRNEAL